MTTDPKKTAEATKTAETTETVSETSAPAAETAGAAHAPSPVRLASESAMLDFAEQFAKRLALPAVLVLVGDVGAGKTTFTRGLAAGLGVREPVTSPSFTISKRYAFRASDDQSAELVHYDFYRLGDPGLMRDELAETLADPRAVTVIEWGQDVLSLLPPSAVYLHFAISPDGSHSVVIAPTQNSNTPAADHAQPVVNSAQPATDPVRSTANPAQSATNPAHPITSEPVA